MNLPAWFRDAPIKRKLLSIGLLTTAFALLFASLIMTVKDIVEWRAHAVSELTTHAKVIGVNAASAMLFDDRKAAAETLAALTAKPDIIHAIIYDQQGKMFAAYEKQPSHPHDHLPSIEPGNYRFTFDYLVIASPIHFKDDTLGSIYLESDLHGLYAEILRSAGLIFLTAFGVFLLAAFLFTRLQKIIVAPILDMSGAMQNVIVEQNFAARVVPHGKDEVGKLAGTFNTMLEYIQLRDTELALYREHLEERTARLTEAQRIAQLGDWEWDVANNNLNWSDEIYCILGLAPQQFGATYEAFLQAVHPEDRQLVDTRVREALEQSRPYSIDYRILLPDGTVRYVYEQAEVLRNVEGQNVKMMGTVQDITERKQAEAEMAAINHELEKANAQIREERAQLAARVAERTAQLLYANRAKDSFLAMMSHEIRTPLGGLLGMMELISLSRLDGEQREMLQAARDSGRSLLRIVNDILDWSKIEAGKLELAPQAATIPEMLRKVASTYAQLASEKGLLLRQQVDSKLGAAHLFDPLRLSQIINNFTSNAIKFTEQGTVEISAELIAQHEGAEQVRFCVKDSGIGIDKEQQSRLFQHYEQASADTARMYGGTGLGLAICRRLAELMEGAISVESTPGRGSTFCLTVSLPVASPAAQRDMQLRQAREDSSDENKPDITPLVKDGKRVTVLVVDDHPINRVLLKRQLEQLALHAEDAASGIVALSLWQTGRFDLIITDCHMPEMNGYELTRSIREMEQHAGRQRMPIIAWTANVFAEEEERCRAAGMDDILTKPTELADLRAMLLKWLAKTVVSFSEAPPQKMISIKAAQNPASANTPIDFRVLKKIATSHAAQTEMLQEFSLHNRSDTANLKAALKDGNQAAVKRSAHRIKGASRMVGALELEGICATIERSAKQGDLNGARVVADTALDETIERIEAAISAFIAVQ